MMRHEIVNRLTEGGIIAVLRLDEPEQLLRAATAIRKGGIKTLEVTMTSPDALQAIQEASHQFAHDPDTIVGVGSVINGSMAQEAIRSGARFVVSPILSADIIEASHRYDVPAIPGAFTPTEIARAQTLGADIVKVFPAQTVGPRFLRAVKGPLPHAKLMPTGGVGPANVVDWIQAGACAVGVGSALVGKEALAAGNDAVLTEKARVLRECFQAAQS